jgi:small nuclear ribonucleoprotein E
MSGRQQRVMVQPINVIFRNLQQKQKVMIWLYDNVEMRIEGRIIGFDEFMNVVIDDAAEVFVKESKPRRDLGRILLKGDNITLIQQVQ